LERFRRAGSSSVRGRCDLGEAQHALDDVEGDARGISGPAISSAVHPALAFSTMASACTRVPLMTQAPETRPGTLSTSSHFDQSIFSVVDTPFLWR